MSEPEMIDVYIRLDTRPLSVGDVSGVGPDDYEMICESVNPDIATEVAIPSILIKAMNPILSTFDMSQIRVSLVRGNAIIATLEYTPPGFIKKGAPRAERPSRYERDPVI